MLRVIQPDADLHSVALATPLKYILHFRAVIMNRGRKHTDDATPRASYIKSFVLRNGWPSYAKYSHIPDTNTNAATSLLAACVRNGVFLQKEGKGTLPYQLESHISRIRPSKLRDCAPIAYE